MNSPSFSFVRRATPFLLAAGALWLPLVSPLGMPCAQAQGSKARVVIAEGDEVSLVAGERVVLPFTNVSRLIVEDDEVARAFFKDGTAIIEGVGEGSTVVQVYQTEGIPRVITVEVGASGKAPIPTPGDPTQLTPAPDGPTPVPTDPKPIASISGTPLTPEPSTLPGEPTAQPDPVASVGSITPSTSQLAVTLAVTPVPYRRAQAQFTITYSNPGPNPAQDAVVRFYLDKHVSYVTNSATKGGRYDAAGREVVWKIGTVAAGTTNQKLSLLVEPVEAGAFTFDSVATIEDGHSGPVSSSRVRYSTTTTPLLTAFAIPDRFLAGRNGVTLVDVTGSENQAAIDRLAQLGVASGYPGGLFAPKKATQRAEYAVMTINGLNLRDLRDITQIKFVLSRPSNVSLHIQDLRGRVLVRLLRGEMQGAGEQTKIWNGRVGKSFAPPGRYQYVCTARDASGQTTTLRGYVTMVSQTPPRLDQLPSFIDVRPTDWYAHYLALGENQGLLRGFPDKTFRPKQPISRVEATAIVVRALGMEDVAKQWANKDSGFLDFESIPVWAKGDVNASTIAKTSSGRPMMRGFQDNTFRPNQELLRDQAALIVQRIIDRETTRRVTVSGAIIPGTVVSINAKTVETDGQGRFSYAFDLNTGVPTSIVVADIRGN